MYIQYYTCVNVKTVFDRFKYCTNFLLTFEKLNVWLFTEWWEYAKSSEKQPKLESFFHFMSGISGVKTRNPWAPAWAPETDLCFSPTWLKSHGTSTSSSLWLGYGSTYLKTPWTPCLLLSRNCKGKGYESFFFVLREKSKESS